MDLLLYDPPLPELPLLGRLRPQHPEGEGARFDWADYVIRLALAVAGRERGQPSA
jgi:hypothetical protein